MTRLLYVIFLATLSALAACTAASIPPTPTLIPTPTAPPTPDPIALCADYIDQYDLLLDRFYDAGSIADSTARVSLAEPVADLQEIRRELDALSDDLPPCADDIHTTTLAYMNSVIESILMFMRDDPSSKISAEIKQAADLRRKFTGQRNLIVQSFLLATRTAEK